MKILSFCLLTLLVTACFIDERIEDKGTSAGTSLIFNMTRASASVINNTQVYLFDGEGATEGQFRLKIPDVERLDDRLSMSIAAGTWNLALLSADTDISGRIISPVRGHDCASLKMWESTPSSGSLPSMPELRTAFIMGQPVAVGAVTEASGTTLLSRNVALVKVVIVDAGGLNVSGTHNFELKDVPTTLNWKGGLYPSKDAPEVSSEAMTGSFAISNHPSQIGRQVSDTLRFIIPAHKGTDYLSPSPTDTTTHCLRLNVNLALEGGARFEKNDVVIPRVPRVNGILLVRLTVGGKLEVSTEILDWVDTEVNADLSQTQLFTDKASVGLAYKDTLHINTNASDYTLDKAPDAFWISLRKLDGNAVEVTADVNSYVDNSPRTSYITVTANNVTKKIPVTQRPDRGTIKASEHKLIFCPESHVQRALDITSIGGDWKFITPSPKATANTQSGVAGATPVTFTRTSTTNQGDFDTYYGDGQIVVKNTTTLDTDTITLVNCFMSMDGNLINAVAPTGEAQTAVTNSSDLTVYGGSQNIGFDSWSNWIHSDLRWNASTQTLTMTTDREPDDEAREGFLTFHHADCPDYKVTARIYQDVIISIPEFDFLLVRFHWEHMVGDKVAGYGQKFPPEFGDILLAPIMPNLDAAFLLKKNRTDGTDKPGFDNNAVGTGYGASSYFIYANEQILNYSNNCQDTSPGGEAFALAVRPLNSFGDADLSRMIHMEIYAAFDGLYGLNLYYPTYTPVMYTYMEIQAYKGGRLLKNTITSYFDVVEDQDYGKPVMVYNETYDIPISGYTNRAPFTTFPLIGTLTYDRVKHSATVKLVHKNE